MARIQQTEPSRLTTNLVDRSALAPGEVDFLIQLQSDAGIGGSRNHRRSTLPTRFQRPQYPVGLKVKLERVQATAYAKWAIATAQRSCGSLLIAAHQVQ